MRTYRRAADTTPGLARLAGDPLGRYQERHQKLYHAVDIFLADELVDFVLTMVFPAVGYMLVWTINGWGYGYYHNLALSVRAHPRQPSLAPSPGACERARGAATG